MSDPITTKKPEPETVLQFKRTSDLGVGECEFVLMQGKKAKAPDGTVSEGAKYLAPKKDPTSLEEITRLFGREFSFKAIYRVGLKFCKELSEECTNDEGAIDDEKFISSFEKIDALGESRSTLVADLKEAQARFFFLITEEGKDMSDSETKTLADKVKAINAALEKKKSKVKSVPALSVA